MSIEERIRLSSYSTFTNTFSLHTRETTCDEDKTCTETSVSVHARVAGDSLGRRARVRRPEVSVHVWPSFDNRHACTETPVSVHARVYGATSFLKWNIKKSLHKVAIQTFIIVNLHFRYKMTK